MHLTRRHRAFTIALASIAAGIFLITRVQLIGAPNVPLRSCTSSKYFAGLSFEDMQKYYHWMLSQLLNERMDMYEGKELLMCSEEKMEDVVPKGEMAGELAKTLRSLHSRTVIPATFTYADFELLLFEFWRIYDCHLFALQHDPPALARAFAEEDAEDYPISWVPFGVQEVERERLRARNTFDRLIVLLRPSEQYLPLHASLRCLQRTVDVRNGLALLSEVSQCAPVRLGETTTSLFR